MFFSILGSEVCKIISDNENLEPAIILTEVTII